MEMSERVLGACQFCKEKYSYLIIGALIIAMIIGLFSSQVGMLLKPLTAPLVMLMIASMGFTMTPRGFALAFREVKGFSFGMGFNFLVAPLLCYTISLLNQDPGVAAGLILVGVVPCAGMAIVWAGLLEADVPLAVLINMGTMILAPFLIPFMMLFLAGNYVAVAVFDMFLTLVYTLLLPLIAGILLRVAFDKKRKNVVHWQSVPPAISGICAMFIMFIAVNTSIPILLKYLSLLPSLVVSTVLIFPVLFAAAYVVGGRIFNRAKNISVTYSSGMKNLPIALGIAVLSLPSLSALVVAIAFIFQMLTAVLFYRFLSHGARRS